MSEFSHFYELLDATKADGDIYWQEKIKMEFAAGIASLMDEKGITQADLARKLDVSDANISKSLRGDRNFQIDTMVSMTRAVGGELHIRVCDQNHRARFVSWVDSLPKRDSVQWAKPAVLKPLLPEVDGETLRAVA